MSTRPARATRATSPLSVGYLVALGATTIAARAMGSEAARRMRVAASTDVGHLRVAPTRALVASAFVIDRPGEFVQLAMVAAALIPLERRIGSVRTAAIFAGGHAFATLATQIPVAFAIRWKRLPESSAHRIDVGPSFGMFAALGAGCGQLPRPLRPWALLGLAGGQSVLDAANRDPVAAAGHALAIGLGALSWPVMRAV